MYTGYRLCASVISGAEDSGVVFLAAGGIFVVIGAVLLIMAIRNLGKEKNVNCGAGASHGKSG